MSATLPQPKYAIGQTVWMVGAHQVAEQWPCPDCGGTKKWTATTAAGEQVAVPCARCQNYALTSHNVPNLYRTRVTVSVRRLTIGSIQTDTAARDGQYVRYMAVETGVGSGSIYTEGQLRATQEEAEAESAALAAEAQARYDAEPAALTAKEFAGMTLRAAIVEAGVADHYLSWSMARRYREAIETAMEDKDNPLPSEVREALEDALGDRPWLRPHPVDTLIDAVTSLLFLADLDAHDYPETAAVRDAIEALRPSRDRAVQA